MLRAFPTLPDPMATPLAVLAVPIVVPGTAFVADAGDSFGAPHA